VLEPLGVALHALDLGHVRVGSSVTVVGCGPIGLLLLQAARAAGATRVSAVEPLEHRRQAALRQGADLAVPPQEPTPPADVVFEAAGSESAVTAAVTAARPGGRVVLVGIPDDDRTAFPAAAARRRGLTLAVARRMGDVYPRTLEVVARGLVDPRVVVSHRFPLEQAEAAFRSAVQRVGLKTVVTL
jgi:L-iditol 2-dehydrogenase